MNVYKEHSQSVGTATSQPVSSALVAPKNQVIREQDHGCAFRRKEPLWLFSKKLEGVLSFLKLGLTM